MVASRNKLSPDLAARVAAWCSNHLPESGPIGLGLSGGCDSVVLLHLLHAQGLGARLLPVHVHHGLSPHADQWARFCVEYSAGLGLNCQVQRVTVDAFSGKGLEAAARAVRYAAFATLDVQGFCLAHHAGDQAETVLFNLLRGAGVSGLAGIKADRMISGVRIWRPLLQAGRAEIENYARQHGLSWIEDESNGDQRYARNFLRHAVFPLLKQRFPAVEDTLRATANRCAEADVLLSQLAEQDWLTVAEGAAARMSGLRQLPDIRLKNLLRHRLRSVGWYPPAAERLDEFVRQLKTAAPDRHPALQLQEGKMVVAQGLLHWQVGN